MTIDITLDKIDVSHWLIKDKSWMEARKAKWPNIESMLQDFKSKKALAAIKQYYLKGKMPNWDSFRDWENSDRHLDLFCFIWMHPSWDISVLSPLRDAYMHSDLIIEEDIKTGIDMFLGNAISMACQNYGLEEERCLLHTDGKNEILFKVLMGNLDSPQYEIQGYTTYDPVREFGHPKRIYEIPKSSLDTLCAMANWLCIKTLFPLNNDMLFQYDQPLEWWYRSCEVDEKYFNHINHKGYRSHFEKALWRIHNFDTQKEGAGPRTTFVKKMRKILDERSFIQEIENLWQKVKAGEILVEVPWEL